MRDYVQGVIEALTFVNAELSKCNSAEDGKALKRKIAAMIKDALNRDVEDFENRLRAVA